ncbi:MAG: ABC transporter ATP-binding protein [Nitrospirae bacterium]|nr:ABC transporter ATP-binding protein [Nitrospirota bacterium]
MIRLHGLRKVYASRVALDGLDLHVAHGEIFGLLGPNGAGKTTTVRMLAGLLQPTGGRIVIGGLDAAQDPIGVKRCLGVIPDRPFIYEKLTGQEYLEFLASIYGMNGESARRRIPESLNFFELHEWRNELVETYSHGMRQRLTIAGALIHSPKLLIVDEPMVGLDPRAARRVKDLFVGLAKNGMTIFLSTHSLDMAEEICHRVGVINQGKLIALGAPDDLRRAVGDRTLRLEEVFLRLVEEERWGPETP